ncbi:hypothetical protein BJ165DRAFT_1425689 [Panaeolus papilionaceus]|nr:hypothetical protein BJ165DRAFT_1425689 [Panaeolus papilionaceus]
MAKKRPAIVKKPSKRTNHSTSKKQSIKFDVKARKKHVMSSESGAETCTIDSPPIKRKLRQPSKTTSGPPTGGSDKENGNRKSYDPADSIVWDIEASNVSLKSQVEEVSACRRTENEGDAEPKVDLPAIAQQSELSLGPSQSASQSQRVSLQQNTQGSPIVDQVSRYFSRPRNWEMLQDNMAQPETQPIEGFMSFDWRSHRQDPEPNTLLDATPTSPQKPRSSSFLEGARDVALHSIEKRRIGTAMNNDASSVYYQEEDELLHPLSDWSFYPAGQSGYDEDVISQMDEQRVEASEGANDWQAADEFYWEETNSHAVLCDDMQCDDWTGAKAYDIWEPIEMFHNQELEDNDATMGETNMDDIWSSYSPVPLHPEYGDEAAARFNVEQAGLEDNAELSVCLQDNHPRFSQGKFLLDRVKREEGFEVQSPVAEAENEVAYRLGQGYWYPQKMY